MRYKVDLKRFLAECEANYYSLCKLIPDQDTDQFSLQLPGHGESHFYLKVLERTPYTSLIEISQSDAAGDKEWMQMPRLKVRLYHDARLAEVVAFEGVHRVRARNSYPNHRMHQPDEKAQWNHFLADWLNIAMRYGYSAVVPCEFGAL